MGPSFFLEKEGKQKRTFLSIRVMKWFYSHSL